VVAGRQGSKFAASTRPVRPPCISRCARNFASEVNFPGALALETLLAMARARGTGSISWRRRAAAGLRACARWNIDRRGGGGRLRALSGWVARCHLLRRAGAVLARGRHVRGIGLSVAQSARASWESLGVGRGPAAATFCGLVLRMRIGLAGLGLALGWLWPSGGNTLDATLLLRCICKREMCDHRVGQRFLLRCSCAPACCSARRATRIDR
jgi:hypothetical protein